jgi:hypothetical protein
MVYAGEAQVRRAIGASLDNQGTDADLSDAIFFLTSPPAAIHSDISRKMTANPASIAASKAGA